MDGTKFLAQVKKKYPDVIRIILTGYTDVDSITESINKGHIYKFFLKPWNDQNLKLEIDQALRQYDLIKANRELHQTVFEQNEILKKMNEDLEGMIMERAADLKIQNQALELSRAILDDLPIPIIGVSAEGLIVMINSSAEALSNCGLDFKVGEYIRKYFPSPVEEKFQAVLTTFRPDCVENALIGDQRHRVTLIPLSGKFKGEGVILTLPMPGGECLELPGVICPTRLNPEGADIGRDFEK
jgi:hypothetical protein